MGQSSSTPTSSPQSPNVTPSHAAQAPAPAAHHSSHDRSHAAFAHGPSARRRESIQALSTVKASAAPPSASLESAAASSPRAHNRARSQTVAAASTASQVANTLRAAHDTLKSTSEDRMGNEQSRHKGHGHSQSQSQPQTQTQPPSLTPPKARPVEQNKPYRPAPSPSPQTLPVDVPAVSREDAGASRTEAASSIEPADASLEGPIVPSSHYSRPPRLPLPIEQEPHIPGSPIAQAIDAVSPIDHGEIEGAIPRRSSMLSTTTADDEDLGDEYKSPEGQETIPTLIEWMNDGKGAGERVYVTGTFAGWNRKYRLHRNGPSKKKDALSAYVHISPGTHHLMFIVDNDMCVSDNLPTAVDYTNILVNYIEVVKDERVEGATEKKSEPVPVMEQRAPDGYRPPQVIPDATEMQSMKKPLPEPKPKIPPPSPKKYHSEIPRYLLDLDAPEESRRFARANAVQSDHVIPHPPSLPMFLNKSILNGVTPMKDDSSVLIMPNHTVLNHLATSSIKDNILATSATTRYKQKFLTTIMYKPRTEDDPV
ncbi:AMPKBI-domain-containing protein [Massarina eburnea CBS 473.64]|uniref:AMPKBI-domain-containing protein n=1 Tax=Massarina eburnea CBS 473.64 TaxID=1395130 RepID=A0A6A6RTP7_9PLEO|nr:AMPKBI-domain-containing protein [Massarina eburnea CBS 473.64]